jgi:cell division protein FtsI/penicillin-binding protein 2
VLGFTNVDNQGLEGLERVYDKMLRGVSGWVLAEKDAMGRMVFPGGPGFQFKMPKPGQDIILTIDEVIQHIAEKELDAALTSARAKGGVCIVMDPQTGEVLALAVRTNGMGRPAFNPNDPQHYKPAEWRNRAVTDAFDRAPSSSPFLPRRRRGTGSPPLERIDCSAGKIQLPIGRSGTPTKTAC